MNNFGFNGLNNENPLLQYLKQYSQQPIVENASPVMEPQRMSSGGIIAFEINSKSDIEYIEPDKSGRKQIYICEKENKIYTGRYNHVRKDMDYRAYIDEGEISLFQKNETDAGMTQIAEALVAVGKKLEAMHNEIQALKVEDSKKEEQGRKPNGQFKKKGE